MSKASEAFDFFANLDLDDVVNVGNQREQWFPPIETTARRDRPTPVPARTEHSTRWDHVLASNPIADIRAWLDVIDRLRGRCTDV